MEVDGPTGAAFRGDPRPRGVSDLWRCPSGFRLGFSVRWLGHRLDGRGAAVGGLRIIPSGRSDAAVVLEPARFTDVETRHAYWVATQIPAVLNQLYCWCGCENRGVHRSNLQCFEDEMGVSCDVCQGTAEIAYEMVQRGITNAGKIQAAVDAKWAPLAHPDLRTAGDSAQPNCTG